MSKLSKNDLKALKEISFSMDFPSEATLIEKAILEISALSNQVKALEEGLRNIMQHQCISVPNGHKMSGTWNIANKALNTPQDKGDK